ncbi:NUDIX domain-containing protein [Jannaschia sp. 2305UL9-9]|uniref:NUDIX domain-containing protein n=1 Tax=Jannaschia sp. 2305UL9-9 TaxID=3121638 RepID=UPI003527B31F
MIPRVGTPPLPETSYRLRPGAYAVILRGGQVLLTRQQLETHSEVQLPGGGIDPGEAPIPALHREILEETGYTCRVSHRIGAYRRFVWMAEYGFHAEKLCVFYLAKAGLHTGPAQEFGHTALWLSPQEALANLSNRHDRPVLARALTLAQNGQRPRKGRAPS